MLLTEIGKTGEGEGLSVDQEFNWGRFNSKMRIRNSNGITYFVILFRNLRLSEEVRARYLNFQVITDR